MKKEKLKKIARDYNLAFSESEEGIKLEGSSSAGGAYIVINVDTDGLVLTRYAKYKWQSKKPLVEMDIITLLDYMTKTPAAEFNPQEVSSFLKITQNPGGDEANFKRLADWALIIMFVGFVAVVLYLIIRILAS